MNHIKFS